MLKLSHKKIQNTGIKMDAKIDAQEQLNKTNMTNIIFTQSPWSLAGSPCFDFSFELR